MYFLIEKDFVERKKAVDSSIQMKFVVNMLNRECVIKPIVEGDILETVDILKEAFA